MKSLQFRSIAPKAPAAVAPCSAPVLACQPSFGHPETNSTPVSPKSILVPAQNYALMQVAGQEGTFSLVALPPSVPPQSPQQQQQQQPIQQNLKLPISRYQPMRTKSTPEKVKSVVPTAGPARGARTPTKVVGTTRTLRTIAAVKKKFSTPEPKEEPSEPVILIDSSPSSEISTLTALLPDNAVLYSGSSLDQVALVDNSTDLRSTSAQGPSPITSILQNLHYPSGAAKTSPAKPQQEESSSNVGNRLSQPQPGPTAQPHPHPASSSITVLSPAIFSKAVQIIPSPPKGKLPILPYSKMKSTLIPAAKLHLNTLSPKKAFPNQLGLPSLTTNLSDPQSKTPETAEALCHNHVPNSLLQSQPQAKTTGTLSLLGSLPIQKPPGKKRGRKRKTMEDILAFEARKKRSLSFFRRRLPEKPSPPAVVSPPGSGQQQGEVDISKKYRSIRPKPHHVMLMETIPQMVSLPSLTSSDSLEPELLVGQPLSTKVVQPGPPQPLPPAAPAPLHLRGVSSQRVYLGNNRPLHRCPTCSRCFQFKHHLQSHMNSHTNSRPYVCPVCRKAYAHSGSLSTHMKLHHSEGRPRRALRCEFCEKAFGYVGVYFSHLREVHRVILTVEPSVSQHEDDVPVEGATSPDSRDAQEEREDPVELQIKCGRCQAITPTFADMKLHLLYVHGEEVQVCLRDGAGGPLGGGREAEDELVKHAAHYWRQLNEKRNLVRCGSCDEEFFSFSKLKRHIHSHHQGGTEDDANGEGEPIGRSARGQRGVLGQGSVFNCVLCSRVMDSKEEVVEHWRGHHHCEETQVLWDALSSYSGEREMDTPPSHSPR